MQNSAAGGTSGPHLVGQNYALERIDSCASAGLQASAYLPPGTTLATDRMMDFLVSPAGLVARQDAGGSCIAALGSVAQPATAYVQGTLAPAAVCDYGTDDSTLSDCPSGLNRSAFHFGGISDW